jgi:hypothetical protein
MLPPLDIFRVAPDGQLLWRAAAEDLDSAQRRIKLLTAAQPGRLRHLQPENWPQNARSCRKSRWPFLLTRH